MSVSLEDIREDLKTMLETDENIRYVDVLADTLEDALQDAAVQLETTVSSLEYEVVERGSKGVMGLVKKNWKIRAYEIANTHKKHKKEDFNENFDEEEKVATVDIIDKDGEFIVRKFNDSIYLKVNLPIGKGDAVDFKQVMNALRMPEMLSIDEDVVKKAVKNGTNGEYEEVGQYKHDVSADSMLVIDISSDDMHAYATVTTPSTYGAEVSVESLKRALDTQGVCAGIDDAKLMEFVDHPQYGVQCEVVTAPSPVDGKNAYIQYNFETDKSKLKMKQNEQGSVDYKELNTIQNVIEGQPLAVKIPAEQGKAGKTLSGRYLEAKNGKDINFPLGRNVYVDTDGVTICAQINGQVLLIGDKISVEPVYQVEGNVGIKTGNISFLGTVIVRGSVEDGYNIKAAGNIEISGTVGKSVLDADGDIIVSQGVLGRDEGQIRAGGSLWAKFIQNTKVDVNDYIFVTDAIMNSDITCNKKIIVEGKKAAIIGGHIFAREAVYSKTIGSPGGGSDTVIEVGIDPKAKLRMIELQGLQDKVIRELDELDLNISTLENNKKVRKRLPPEKEIQLTELKKKHEEVCAQSEQITEELTKIQDDLRALKELGKVAASGQVYSGVKIYVRDIKDEVRSDLKGVTFYYENAMVRRGKYEPPSDEDLKRSPSGYSTN